MNLPRISVRNPVAVNLLMWAIILTGFYYGIHLRREFFPNVEPDQVFISVAYPGSTPAEIEKSVTRQIEREIEDVDDIEEITSSVLEGLSLTVVTLEEGADADRALNDLRGELDKVKPYLPEEIEDPEIRLVRPVIPVIGLAMYGDVPEDRLHDEAIEVRDDLMELPGVSEVVISGHRRREIWAEIRPEKLEEFALTFEEVGRAVAAGNLDLPGGQLKGLRGNVSVRTLGETERALILENLVVRTQPNGTAIRLRELGRIRETFEDKIDRGSFGGKPAVLLVVFKTPEEDALQITDQVKEYVANHRTRLSGALAVTTIIDIARFIAQRLDLMIRNARWGLFLVGLTLAFFLDLRVALWVAVGLPISFLGTFIVMHLLGVTINLVTLLGLIVVLGLIVDDAILIGESVFTKMRQGLPAAEAAVEGATEVSIPVLAAVLTTIAAFLPLGFIEGRMGAYMGVLPVVLVAALGVSLVEAFVILPTHLAHRRKGTLAGWLPRLSAWASRTGDFKHYLVEQYLADRYERLLGFTLRWRYPALAGAIGFSLGVAGLVRGGIVPFVFIQDADAENMKISLEMAAGTPEELTTTVVAELEQLARSYPEVSGVFSVVGSAFDDRGQPTAADPATVGELTVELLPADQREAEGMRSSMQLISEMRRRTALIPGVNKLSFLAAQGGPAGADIEIRVRGEDLATVARAVAYVRKELGEYGGVSEIEDNLNVGKIEAQLRLREPARLLGLTTRDLALQVRHALFGFEAQRLQGEDEEVRVRALLPEAARRDLEDIARLRIATPRGGRVPLEEVAAVSTARGYATLARADGKRAVTVKAEVDEETGNVAEITSDLAARLADIGSTFPGTSLSFEGERKETTESLGSLKIGFPVALLMIYAIIATLFRSYTQPVIVMLVIPFAFVGAVLGHLIMGYPFTILSMIGGVALAGIVVNDNLILVNFINRLRGKGVPLMKAVVQGGRARMRAILLTTITTIAGLAPLMMERSFQAQFMIPMAVSIAYGLAFGTVLTLLLLPTLYVVLEDVRVLVRWLFTGTWSPQPIQQPATA